jgi:hypothetical protein
MYILAPNQIAEIYPYSIGNLRRDNPNVSFPRNPSDALLASYNVFPVVPLAPPDYDPITQNLNQATPTLVDGQWLQTWQVTDASAEEIAERQEAADMAKTFMVNGSYRSGVTAVPDFNIDCLEGNYFTKTIDGSSTFTVSNIPANSVYAFTLKLNYLSGTVTWFSDVKWPGGSAPPLVPNYVNVLSFMTDDNGASWYGAAITNYTN